MSAGSESVKKLYIALACLGSSEMPKEFAKVWNLSSFKQLQLLLSLNRPPARTYRKPGYRSLEYAFGALLELAHPLFSRFRAPSMAQTPVAASGCFAPHINKHSAIRTPNSKASHAATTLGTPSLISYRGRRRTGLYDSQRCASKAKP
jgi:hypothetical protein